METSTMIDRLQDVASGQAPQFDELKEQAMIFAAAARERLADGSGKIREYIVKEPARALGIALGVGVLLGWLTKRR